MTIPRIPMRPMATLALVAQLLSTLPSLAAAAVTAPAATAAKPAASPLLRKALGLYTQSRYDEAINVVFAPVNSGELKGADLRDARVLMARCYVKKGLGTRAKDLFSAVVKEDPAFVLDATRGDAEEIAVFNEVKPPAAPAKPKGPAVDDKASTAAKPTLHKPEMGPSPDKGPGWLARHKLLAATLAVGAGAGVAVLASSGGGGGGEGTPVGPKPIADFPRPPSRAVR